MRVLVVMHLVLATQLLLKVEVGEVWRIDLAVVFEGSFRIVFDSVSDENVIRFRALLSHQNLSDLTALL